MLGVTLLHALWLLTMAFVTCFVSCTYDFKSVLGPLNLLVFSISETVGKGCESNLQQVVDDLSRQSSSEGFQLNEAKCKELRISFANSNCDL